MGIPLKPTSLSASSRTLCFKVSLLAALLVIVTFLGFYSQPQLFDRGSASGIVHVAQKFHAHQGILNPSQARDRPLIVYAYAESENARDNLKFFLKRGLHAAADFIFIFNGETDASELVPRNLENIKIVQRDNTCFDIGAFGEVLSKDALWQRYKRFITMNASIRGPFLPFWSDQCWTDALLSKITDKVKLVGLTYHCMPAPHVQSMLLATDRTGMEILLDPKYAYSVPLDTSPWGEADLPTGYSICYEDYVDAVHAEIGMSRLIRSQGYEVAVMLTSFQAYSPSEYCAQIGDYWSGVDQLGPGHYFGSNIHPYEVMFAKANRGIDDGLLNHFTNWHYNISESSWEKCSRNRV